MDRQNSGLGALLIVVLGAIALVVPLNLAQSAPPKPSTVSRSAAYSLPAGRHEPTEHSAEDLIADFLDADPGLLPEDGPWSRSDRQWPAAGQSWPQDRNGRDNRSLYQIEYLIVTLPDPLAPALQRSVRQPSRRHSTRGRSRQFHNRPARPSLAGCYERSGRGPKAGTGYRTPAKPGCRWREWRGERKEPL